ncbi:MAG: transketolase C-terminal domain-containing protein, partial [Alphaproteobacteria bacterium]
AKPLDTGLVERLARHHEVLITVEEGSMGGFGSYVLAHLANNDIGIDGLKLRTMTLPDCFQDQDKPDTMYDQAGLSAQAIVQTALKALGVALPHPAAQVAE